MNIEAKKFVLFHIYRGVTPVCPLHWQPEVDSELTLSASTAAALDQKSLLPRKLWEFRCNADEVRSTIVLDS